MQDPRHEAFARLVVQQQHRVYRFILTLVRNPVDAEDLFQQTLLTVWSLCDEYDTGRPFLTWAFGIAHNHVRNFIRMRRRRGEGHYITDEILDQLAEAAASHEPLVEERRAALPGCMEKLAPDQRQLLEEVYGRQQAVPEIAQRRNISAAALHKVLQRTRRSLFDCINKALQRKGTV